MAYQDTLNNGQFIWNGDYYSGDITTMTINGKIAVFWNFVKISSFNNKSYNFVFPVTASSQDCNMSFNQPSLTILMRQKYEL